MLQVIRDRATGWIAYTIIILICIPFVLWGVNSYFGNPAIPDVAFVGGDAISQQDFQRAYQQSRARAPNADDTLLKQQVLQQLIDRQLLEQATDNLDFRLSDQQLDITIRANPDFQENGAFSINRYQRLLLQSGTDPVAYEQGLRQAMAVSQLQQGLVESAFITDNSLTHLIELQNQKRHIEMLVLPLDKALESQTVDEEEIINFYKENGSRYQNPEKVKIQYLELNLDKLASDIEVSNAELEQAYQERITQYTIPEERKASHILISVPADASSEDVEKAKARVDELYDVLQSGTQTFADIESVAGDEPSLEVGELGIITKGMMEPSFEDALFSLTEPGAISEPVKTSFGYHIIKLDEITPAQITAFDEVKDELMLEIRQQRAEPEFFSAAEILANLSFEHQDSLQVAAEALGLNIQESDWIERSGSDDGIAKYPSVVNTAFGEEVLQEGYNSQVLEVEPSHLIVIRKLDYQPSQPLSLEEARASIEEQLKQQKAREQLQAQVEDLMEQVKNGASMQQLADQEENIELQQYDALERNTPGIDRAARDLAFRLTPTATETPAIGSVSLTNGDQAIVAVLDVNTETETDDSTRDLLRATLERQIGLSQYQSFVTSQRAQAEIVTYPDRL